MILPGDDKTEENMRYGINLGLDWEIIAAQLAQEDSIEQTKFFKAFVKELLSWGTNFQVETQLAHVNMDLSSAERAVLLMLGYKE